MKTYEYKIAHDKEKEFIESINELGKEGYRVVQLLWADLEDWNYALMEKEITYDQRD